ncbi:MAG: glycosyltransferase family 2 protein [Candidatus ainarchaeum sp.]|nr:glycosyltransferase family 2 protein [Candidatus ainarchaeum sp.]
MPKTVSIIIPTLNEVAGIRKTIESIPIQNLKKLGYDLEILIIDGDSKDGTIEEVKKTGTELFIEKRRGYGRAYKTGFEKANGEIFVTIDADGTYPAEKIPELLEKFKEEKLDFLTTDRFHSMKKGSMSARNKLGNAVLSITAKTLFGIPFNDSQSGMWILTKDAWNKVKDSVLSDGMAFSQELKIEMYRNKLKCKEIGIEYDVRFGKPKLNPWKDGINNLLHLLKKRI